MSEKHVTFTWQGHSLFGVLHVPEGMASVGVLYVHGLPGDRVDARRLPVRFSRLASRCGITCLRVDMFASGISDGQFHQVTYADQVTQLQAILEETKKSGLWPERTVLLSMSEAGKLALRIAGDNRIDGLCFWSAIITQERESPARITRLHRFVDSLVVDVGCGLWFSSQLVRELGAMGITSPQEFPNIPMLAIYGLSDPLTTASRQMFLLSRGTVISIPGADHLFTSATWEQMLINETLDWVVKSFGEGQHQSQG